MKIKKKGEEKSVKYYLTYFDIANSSFSNRFITVQIHLFSHVKSLRTQAVIRVKEDIA